MRKLALTNLSSCAKDVGVIAYRAIAATLESSGGAKSSTRVLHAQPNKRYLFPGSSMVERAAVNCKVVGSNPTRGAQWGHFISGRS